MKTTVIAIGGIAVFAAFSFALAPAGKAQDAVGGPIAEKLLGYWSVDSDKMLEKAKEEAEAKGGKFEGAEAEMAKKMIEMMGSMVVIQFQDSGKVTAHTPDGPEDATYEISDAEAATGKFTISIDPPDQEAKTGKGRIRGDKMSLKVDGEAMHMVRITAAEAAVRKKKIENFDPSKLFDPGAGAPEEAPAPPEAPAKD